MIDWNQNSNKPYLKIRYKGKEHTFALPFEKKVPNWENMSPDEFEEKQQQLINLAGEIERSVITALNENLSEEEFVSQMLLIFRRLTRVLLNTPVALFAVKWAFEQALRNKPTPTRVWHVCNGIRRFLQFLGDAKDRPVSSLKSHQLEKHVRLMRKKNLYAPSLMNVEVATLRSFARAIDPTGRLGRSLEKEAVVYFTRKPLTIPQLRRIMRFLKRRGPVGEEWRTLLLILLYTPIRPTAASKLTFDMIDFDAKGSESITCYDKGKLVTCGIPTLLLECLQELRAKIKRGKLTPKLSTLKGCLNPPFVRILRANGISVELVDPKYGRRKKLEHCLYDLRHRFSNWVFGLTLSKHTTKQLTNHDTDQAMEHYLNLKDPFVLEQQRKVLDLAPRVI
jgi:integrase